MQFPYILADYLYFFAGVNRFFISFSYICNQNMRNSYGKQHLQPLYVAF